MTQRWKTVLAFAIGVWISAIGYFSMINGPGEIPKHTEYIAVIFSVLFIPGLFVGLLAGSNVHDASLSVAAIANAVLYGFILRLIFKKFWKGSLGNGTEE